MTVNPTFVVGVDELEDQFYNHILPMLESVTNGADKRCIETLRIQTIGDYPNKKGSRYFSVVEGFVKDGVIPRSILGQCLIISVKDQVYNEFFKRIVYKAKIGPKNIDVRTSGSACLVFVNPSINKKLCIIINKDMNEMIADLKKDDISLFSDEIPVEIAVQSVLLHELVHATDFLNAENSMRKVSTYKNWREVHAYSVQFEWIDKKLGRDLILQSMGARTYKSAAEKFITQVINKQI